MATRKTPSKGGKPDKILRDALLIAMHREVPDDDGKMRKRFNIMVDKLAQKACEGDLPTIREVFDRIEGKPAQEATVTLQNKHDATDWTRDELVTFLNNAGNGGEGASKTPRRIREPDSVH